METISDFPSEDGNTTFKVIVQPVSSQATRAKKDLVTEAIRKITKPVPKILSGDVKIEIIWFTNENERYESDNTADLDNIIKPILDALSGPDGIIINDCQVQSLGCSWQDRYGEPEHIEINLRYEPDAWFEKGNIMFVQLQDALCMPICKDFKLSEVFQQLLNILEKRLSYRNSIINSGRSYYEARGVMSIQRLFHRTRLNGFEVKRIDELREDK